MLLCYNEWVSQGYFREGFKMDSLLFALGAVTPIILVVAVGYFLKRIGLMKPDFAKAANRLVFHAFLPVTLFLNVYHIEEMQFHTLQVLLLYP